jgi:hypothetical protein
VAERFLYLYNVKKPILLLFLLFSIELNAQQYFPFPDSNAVWRSYYSCCPGFCDYNTNDEIKISLASLTGNYIWQNIQLTGKNKSLNISELKPGFYILNITDKSGNLFSQKLLKL